MSAAPDDLPVFDVSPRELDVRNLLQEDGNFDDLQRQAPESVDYQIGSKCESCAYKEACFTDALEEFSTAVLGMSIGDQNRLAGHGIKTVHDLAELAFPEPEARPYDYKTELIPRRDLFEDLRDDPELGPEIHHYVQQAHAMLGKSHGRGSHASSGDGAPPYLLGSGDGSLPDDDPPYETTDLPVARGDLIRIYLNVQHDSRRDRVVMCAGYATATNYADSGGEPYHLSEIAPDLSMDADASLQEERAVLDGFWDQLTEAVSDIAASLGRADRAPIHLYLYTDHERTALMDAATRHDDGDAGAALRDLLSLRQAAAETSPDQAMVSVLQNEVQSRFALPIPNSGLMPVKHLFSPSADRVPNYDWEFTRSDGTHIDNLRDVFRFKMFDYTVRYRADGDGLELHVDGDPDGWYPSRFRGGAQIPLEYVWAALGQLTEDWVEGLTEDYDFYQSLEPFLWLDRDRKTTRIIPEDLEGLGEYLAQCVAHIERGIRYRNTDLTKHPVELRDLFSLGESTLAGSLEDFLHLEHHTARSEDLTHLAQPVRQRVQSGQAIPLVVTAAELQDDGTLYAEGRLLYDRLFPEDHERIANACRKKATEGSTGGSWMIANELTPAGEPAESATPTYLERGPGVTIEALEVEDHSIEFSAFHGFMGNQEFTRYHRPWAVEGNEARDDALIIDEQTILILDPRTDDLTSQRAFNVLDAGGEQHPVLGRLENMAAGEQIEASSRTDFADEVETFVQWCETNLTPETLPSTRQGEFIRETQAQFSLLQGPPGTGKTGGSLALAVVARLYAWAQRDHPLIGTVAGESNKAVDEVLEDIADIFQEFVEHPETNENPYDNVELVRLTNEPRRSHIPTSPILTTTTMRRR
ncbi:AAA domain-containing protein [Halalkalicoccus salilacus]|uniref:AAA domain-containing protein n=1 Tax=Halalkalicoccus sp. GCM10025704 TaxID=3252662 RepID=UPI00360C9A42